MQENKKLIEWISSILKAFGEQQQGNCAIPVKIPYFKHNKEFNDIVSYGCLFPTEEIIIPELHIIVRGI